MTKVAAVYTALADSVEAGKELAQKVLHQLDGKVPGVVILFASPRYHYEPLLKELQSACPHSILVGCSSAGEFATDNRGEGAASALAISSDEMRFSLGVGRDIGVDFRAAASAVTKSFNALEPPEFAHRSALVLADALSGRTDELIEEMTALTGGTYKFFGGGAGGDARFTSTHVFAGTEAITDAVVALEILSKKQIGIGVAHGWEPTGNPMRVTEAKGNRLVGLNAIPAAEAFAEHAQSTGQEFNRDDPVPFFLHNVLGIQSAGGYKLRVPLAVEPGGAVICASDIPEGATVQIMKSASNSAKEAAAQAVKSALSQTEPSKPAAALFFDCVATRLRLGLAFEEELGAVKNLLGTGISYVGCNTYGQIARAEDQFSGFHNCTAVVCTFPE